MASATTMALPTELFNIATTDDAIEASLLEDDDQLVDYWVDLIRFNLEIASSATSAHSDAEDEQTTVSEEIRKAPRRKSPRDSLAKKVAARLYPSLDPNSLAPIIQYEKDLRWLRNIVLEQRQIMTAKASERNDKLNWIQRIAPQGPWKENDDPLSLSGTPSLPMPVEVSDKESLAPFFAHLRNNGTHEPTSSSQSGGSSSIEPFYNTEMMEFEKGVLYADGRVDLCKMVTGPRNIGDLMESLRPNTFSRHFLLGNNIIGATGAQAIAAFIDDFPDRFETWYLAGNCIDSDSFELLVDSMVKSAAITNVWLKRNPLGPSAARDVFRLATQTPSLRTLDLDQTEIGDAGVAELFKLLTDRNAPIALRHIYLSGTGVSKAACEQISRYLKSPHCALESLYMSNNPIGSAVTSLSTGLEANSTLKRLSIQSCGLTDARSLFDALASHKTLEVLDIGQSYSTEDLGMRYNWLSDDCEASIVHFIKSSPNLRYFNLSYVPLLQQAIYNILIAVSRSNLLSFFIKPLFKHCGDASSIKLGQATARLNKFVRERLHENVQIQYDGMSYEQFDGEHKRFLISPKDVRFIDSVYRNRDAGEARRGLKILDKWWKEDDVTLKQVRDGTLI